MNETRRTLNSRRTHTKIISVESMMSIEAYKRIHYNNN